MQDFEALEKRLTALLSELDGVLTPLERGEVTTFVDVGEYGVALETLVAICVDEGRPLEKAQLLEIEDLAETMGIKQAGITDSLRRLHQ